MAFSLVAHASVSGSGTNTSAIDTTGANLIVVGVSLAQVGDAAIADSKSNAWTKITTAAMNGNDKIQLFYSLNPTVGSSHTFNATGTIASILVEAYSGAAASSVLDQQNTGTSSSSTTVQPGSVTPAQNNELVIALAGSDTGTDHFSSINGGFTATDNIVGGASAFETEMAYLIQTTAAAANPTFTFVSTSAKAAIIATFKVPASGHSFGTVI